MYRILLVEDDAVIREEIVNHLAAWGMDARPAMDFRDVLGTFSSFEPHLVLMDVSLPFHNGFYWCSEIRKCSKVPVVFLSSRSDNMDVVMAINMGGDDYIAKPVSLDVLTAKVQAMLRRAYDYDPGSRMTFCGVSFDPAALLLHTEEKSCTLTRNEARILQSLLNQKGEIVTREALMLALWDSDAFVDDNTLTVNVNRLRKTLAEAGISPCIVTHKNRGYALCE